MPVAQLSVTLWHGKVEIINLRHYHHHFPICNFVLGHFSCFSFLLFTHGMRLLRFISYFACNASFLHKGKGSFCCMSYI